MRWVFYGDNGIRAGWRALIFLVLFAIVIGGVGVAGALLVFRGDPSAYPATSVLPLQEAAGCAAVIAATFFTARIERQPFGAYGFGDRAAVSHAAAGFVTGVVAVALLIGMLLAAGAQTVVPSGVGPQTIAVYGVAWLAVFALVAVFEEGLFRGYLLRTLANGMRFWPAAIVLAVIFGALHITNRGEAPLGAVGAGTFGLVMAYAVRQTGSLWLPIGMHAGWDWAQSWLFGRAASGLLLPGTLLQTHPRGPALLSGGSVGPEGSILEYAVIGALVAFIASRYRRRGSDSIPAKLVR